MKKTIISANEGGIANRVFCLVNAIHLSEKTGHKVVLYWKEDKDVTGKKRHDLQFNDLFKKKIGITLGSLKPFKKNPNYIILTSEKLVPEKKDIIRILKSLKFKFELDVKPNVGFHIRRGDFVKIGIAKVSPLDLFEKYIGRTIGVRFLASDNSILKKDFATKHKMITANSLKDDLEYLSKSDILMVSYGSTFSQLAWYLGSCKPYLHEVVDTLELHKWKNRRKGFMHPYKTWVYNKLFR